MSDASLLVCADWSASARGRRAWAADAHERAVFRVDGRTVEDLLAEADELRGGERALVCFDAPIGLPAQYLRAVGFDGFIDWLMNADFDAVFAPVTRASDWSTERPFIRPERGEWTAVVGAVTPGVLWRGVDVTAKSESVFKLIGAKQVGRAAQELWRELRATREAGVDFTIWPFESNLDGDGVTVCEIYPRLAYGAALVKSNPSARAAAIAEIEPRVRLLATPETEDDFDAAITAVALLGRLLDGRKLCDAEPDRVNEGGILLAG